MSCTWACASAALLVLEFEGSARVSSPFLSPECGAHGTQANSLEPTLGEQESSRPYQLVEWLRILWLIEHFQAPRREPA